MGIKHSINEKAIEGKAGYESVTKTVMLHHFAVAFPLIGCTDEIVSKKSWWTLYFESRGFMKTNDLSWIAFDRNLEAK